MTFQIGALPGDTFHDLFEAGEDELARRNARLVVVGEGCGAPCRVSLQDAAPGEEVLLAPFDHQPAASPFRASGPIYVRRGATQARPSPGEVPDLFRSRLMSLRAYSAEHMIVDADVAPGAELEPALERLLASPAVAYLHLHFARPGCYAARVERL